MQTPYLIAEIGVNYYDSAQTLGISPLEAAKRYIQACAKANVMPSNFSPTRPIP